MKRTITLIIIIGWILIPTGTPDDIIAWYLIKVLGQYYFILLAVLLLVMWHYKINLDKIKKTMKGLFK